jgi:hypothetical protein
MMPALRHLPYLTMLRWIALTVGAALLVIEVYDAFVTPGIDWFWIALAILQIYVCRPRRSAYGAETPNAPA